MNHVPRVAYYLRAPWNIVVGSDSVRFVYYENGLTIFRHSDSATGYLSVQLDETERQRFIQQLPVREFFLLREEYTLVSGVEETDGLLHVFKLWDGEHVKQVAIEGQMECPENDDDSLAPPGYAVRIWEREPPEPDPAKIQARRRVLMGEAVPEIERSPDGEARVYELFRPPNAALQLYQLATAFQHPQARPWLPEKVEVMLWSPAPAMGEGIPWPQAWPDLDHPDAIQRGDLYSIFVDSRYFEQISDIVSNDKPVLLDNYQWAMSYRFPLPGEDAIKA